MSPPADDFGPPEPIGGEPAAAAAIRRYRELQAAPMSPEQVKQEIAAATPPTGGAESFLSKAAESVPIIGAPYNKAVAALESVSPFFSSRHLEHGEGDYQPKTYEEALAQQKGLMEQRHEQHPVLTKAGELTGQMAGYMALPGGAFSSIPRAAASSGAIEGLDALARGEKRPEVFDRALKGAAGGAAGAYIGKGLGNWLGRHANEAAREAVTGGTQSAAAKFDEAFEPLGALVPGEQAAILREAGIAGGLKGPKGVQKGVEKALQDVNEEFGGLIKSADATGTRVPLTAAQTHLDEAIAQNLSNERIGKVAENFMQRLQKHADASGTVSHRDLQDVLKTLNLTARNLYGRQLNEGDLAFKSAYRALRATQDEGLSAALGRDAADVRRYSAVMHDILPIAEKAVHRAEGNHPVGLIGEIRKGSAGRDIALGAATAATGSPVVGGGLILKGALGWLGGQFGKAASPYRANVLTSVFGGLQQPAVNAFQRGIPQAIGANLAGGSGAPAADEFGPPEPMAPPLVAKKGH